MPLRRLFLLSRLMLAVAVGAAVALAAGLVSVSAGTAQAGSRLPCDIYASVGTPCVAAHSTVRALYAAYNGPLY